MAAPSPTAYGWGQQLVTGMLVPHQPMGLGPGTVVQGEPPYPTGSSVLHVPARPATPPPHGPTLGAGPPCAPHPARQCPEAIRDLQQGRGGHRGQRPCCQPPPPCPASNDQQNHDNAQSLASTAFLNDFHNFSQYVEDGGCPQDKAVVARLQDSEDTILIASVPNLTKQVLDELPDLSEYVAEGSCPKSKRWWWGWGTVRAPSHVPPTSPT
ncbi:uncharacterized protein LOC128138488 [Harpia harpyja]|uniref:uncharacterized protein LOC128138488 n=1 Tax=Harpia harpyja TaxID=202280 RepID=UPI0022B0CC4E|nr:uncharacterized protein LOC128138488 [Harpia harpyja]